MTKPTYPFEQPPQINRLQEIAPRIYWLRLAMPFKLDHINLWLIEEDSCWTLIDTGPDTATSKTNWLEIFSNQLKGKPIEKIICTHAHPDHIGLAGWIGEQQSAQLLMSKGEFEFYHQLFADIKHTSLAQVKQFYQSAGASDKQVKNYLKHIQGFRKMISPMPSIYQQLQNNDRIKLGNYQWQIHIGKGHSPEHICLFCDELNMFISGDQLLPTISSNISVWPTEPNADPMSDFLATCHDFNKVINNQTLILPAHGLPFHGGVNRLNTLLEDAEKDLNKLYEFCQQPRKVSDVFPILFKVEINVSNVMLAYGEALANLNYLYVQGKIMVTSDENNINYYQQS